MKKIGTTESGSILAEFSQDEWLSFSITGEVTRDESLYEWSDRFTRDFKRAIRDDLPARVSNSILRCAHVWSTRSSYNEKNGYKEWDVDPYVKGPYAFSVRKHRKVLLNFPEWVDAVLSREIDDNMLLYIRNFGKKSLAELRIALVKYQAKEADSK